MIVKKFLYFPLRIKGEWRWWRYALIKQELRKVGHWHLRGYSVFDIWINVEWAD